MRTIHKIIGLIISILLIPTQSFAKENNIIGGNNPTETAIQISNNWQQSNQLVLVNSKAKSDILCATVLASQINCPILLTSEDDIPFNTLEEINRLQPNQIYIIGGVDVISQQIEDKLQNTINTQRISGNDRYETSVEVASIINSIKPSTTAIIVNGHYSVADTISIAPIAGSKNIPIIISEQNDITQGKEWIYENNIETTYIIGGSSVISENIEQQMPNPIRIGGSDRYDTNIKIIETFYDDNVIDTLFYCNGIEKDQSLLEGMIAVPLLVTKNSPIILIGNELSTYQKDTLFNKRIDNLVQIGYGINEKVKDYLLSLKSDSSTIETKPPEIIVPPYEEEIPNDTIEPSDKEETTEDTILPPEDEILDNIEPPLDEDVIIEDNNSPEVVDINISEDKKIITIMFNEKLNNTIENIKEYITIKIEDKIMKLNKYDKAYIEGDKIIIELQDGLLATNNTILITENIISDESNNYISNQIELNDLEGLNKVIKFVKDDKELSDYLNSKDKIDIIKLENDIQISLIKRLDVRLDDIIIDGSNGELNYKLQGISKYVDYEFSILRNNVVIKNLDMDNIFITATEKVGIQFKNINMSITKANVPAIKLNHTIAEVEDLSLQSGYAGIFVTSDLYQILSSRSSLTLKGLIKNNNGPSIILWNPITNQTKDSLNTIINETDINDLTEIYNIETKTNDKEEIRIYNLL